jgi:hypothetical protein
MISNKIDNTKHRHDLGSHKDNTEKNSEYVTQIMWPSLYFDNIFNWPMHSRLLKLVKLLLGDDMEFDFDMMI